jgi:membrane associated rhomboid family serine protease
LSFGVAVFGPHSPRQRNSIQPERAINQQLIINLILLPIGSVMKEKGMIIPIGDEIERTATPFQFATIFMVAACVGVWGWQVNLPYEAVDDSFYAFGLVPAFLFGFREPAAEIAVIPPALTVITSMFMHGSWSHIIGNMLYLWVFGSSMEEACGHVRFVIFYILCGIGAGLGHALVEPAGVVPMIGASGAISGLLAAYMLVYPYNKVTLLVLILSFIKIRLPALLVIGFWIAYQIYEMFAAAAAPEAQAGGGIAWTAHVGGFATGALLIFVLRRPGVKLMQEPALR